MSLIANCLAKLVKQGKLSQQQADATTRQEKKPRVVRR
jgi:hypothetical protein